MSAQAEGGIRLIVDVRVDVREMATWPPECVYGFFAGIALVKESTERARAVAPSPGTEP